MTEAQLPFAYEAETAVIGSILLEPRLLDECTLSPEDFGGIGEGDKRHELIFSFIRYLEEIGEPIDLQVMAHKAGKQVEKFGGFTYLMELVRSVHSVANFERYQKIVRETSIKRQAVTTLREIATGAADSVTPSETIAEAIDALGALLDASDDKREMRKLSETGIRHKETLQTRKEEKGMTGARGCSDDLNRITGGHQDGDFIVTAARPSIGKTAYALNDSVVAAGDYIKRNVNGAVAIFSLEMDEMPIYERTVCIIGNIDAAILRSGNMSADDWERYEMAQYRLNQLPLYIDDSPGQTIQGIRRKIKNLKKKFEKLYVIIDFLQLIDPGRTFKDENRAVAYVSKQIKQIAREFKCPINAISAVGRKCEERQNKRPMLSDLRESGSIESDADIVQFLYRDDYYHPESDKKGIVEIILAKGRNVGTGTVEMVYNRKTSRFLNLERQIEI